MLDWFLSGVNPNRRNSIFSSGIDRWLSGSENATNSNTPTFGAMPSTVMQLVSVPSNRRNICVYRIRTVEVKRFLFRITFVFFFLLDSSVSFYGLKLQRLRVLVHSLRDSIILASGSNFTYSKRKSIE
jgi:hypothetical protein